MYKSRWDEMAKEVVTPAHSVVQGSTLTGHKIEVGYYKMPRGGEAHPHSHPNEQIVCILEGRLRYRVGSEEGIAVPGDVLHMPSGVEHQTSAVDEDVIFINCKDLVEGVGSRQGAIRL